MDSFHVSDVAEEIPADEESIEALRTDAVSLEVMSFEPGDEDPMHAHSEDEIYHVDANPPVVEGVCDVDGGELQQRADDEEDVIRTRLRSYVEDTAPLESFYEERGLLRDVEAVGHIDDVTRRALEVLAEVEPPRTA